MSIVLLPGWANDIGCAGKANTEHRTFECDDKQGGKAFFVAAREANLARWSGEVVEGVERAKL